MNNFPADSVRRTQQWRTHRASSDQHADASRLPDRRSWFGVPALAGCAPPWRAAFRFCACIGTMNTAPKVGRAVLCTAGLVAREAKERPTAVAARRGLRALPLRVMESF